jgi:hypothetical protein
MAKPTRYLVLLLAPFAVTVLLVALSRPFTESTAYHVARQHTVAEANLFSYYDDVVHYILQGDEGLVLDVTSSDLRQEEIQKTRLHVRSDRRLATIGHPVTVLFREVIVLGFWISVLPTLALIVVAVIFSNKGRPNQRVESNAVDTRQNLGGKLST